MRESGVRNSRSCRPGFSEAVLNVVPKPDGFTAGELAAGTGALLRQSTYTPRHTAYDLRKIRSKGRIGRVGRPGGAGRLKPGRPPKEPHPLDVHHENLQREMRRTFRALRLAA